MWVLRGSPTREYEVDDVLVEAENKRKNTMVLIIDNYDSFTYNIYQSVCTMADDVKVLRNDEVTAGQLEEMEIEHLIISPGPGRPEGAGVSMEAIRLFAGRIPILGVCLGHQSIGQVFGCKVVHATRIMHGKSSMVQHEGKGVFAGLSAPFEAIRYHSLALQEDTLPEELEVTARAEDGEIMAIRHTTCNIEGVQFHPESFGTMDGDIIFRNFLESKGGLRDAA
jgi:anthranilate synthase/aminodeoxychorismate synthase-like glutamine amidotransferase